MLDNQTLEQLRRLRLSGMAAAFAQQLEQPELQTLSFEERFSLLLDRELNLRENRRLNRLLQLARLRQPACVEDIDYTHRRGLERSLMATLVTCDWIRAHHNLHLTGPTGTGKAWLACALGQQACRQGSQYAMNEWPACWKLCASPAATALITNAWQRSPKLTC